jgi:hypothetical protein
VPPKGVFVRTSDGSPVEVRMRRFGDGFPAKPNGKIAARSAATVGFPSDASPLPWRLSLRSRSPLSACGLA